MNILFRNRFFFGISETGRTDIVAQAYGTGNTPLGSLLTNDNFTEAGDGEYIFNGEIDQDSIYVKAYRTGDTTISNSAVVPFDPSKSYGTETSVAPDTAAEITATSLDSVDNADAYFALKLNTGAWDNADSDIKQLALNDATEIINRFEFIGCKTVSTQANEFPRSGILFDNILLDETLVPDKIRKALYEIAFALLRGVDTEREIRSQSVISRGFSTVRTTYDPRRTLEHIQYGVPSAIAWLYLLPFLNRESGVIRLHRVN